MKASDFKEFIKSAKKIISKRNFAILNYLLFKDGYVIARSFEDQIQVKKKFDIEGEFLIDFFDFEKIINKLKDEKIIFSTDEKTIYIKSGKNVFSFLKGKNEKEDIKDFPTFDVDFNNESEILFKSDIEKIKRAKIYCSKDETRPVLNNVFLDKKNIVATNAHILSFEVSHERKNTLLMPVKVIDIMDDQSMKVFINRELKEFTSYILLEQSNGIEITFIECEDKFVDWKCVVPKENKIRTEFLAKEILRILDLAALSAPESNFVKFDFNKDLGILKVSTQDLDYGKSFNGEIKSSTNENIKIGFDYDLFIKIIKNEKFSNIKIDISSPDRATIINDFLLLFPMVIHEDVLKETA